MASYEVRPITADEVGDFVECEGVSFGSRVKERHVELAARFLPLERTVAVVEGVEIVGTASSFELAMTLPGGSRLPVAAVSDVTVAPTHRRRGLLTSMMRFQLDALHEAGEPLAALYASEAVIYGRFGYGITSQGVRTTVERRRARFAREAEPDTGSVRLVTRGQALESFPGVLTSYQATRPGEIDRRAFDWPELVGEGVDEAEARELFVVAYEDGGSIDGYAVYRVSPFSLESGNRGRSVVLEELCALSDGAHRGLWSFLVGIDLTDEVRAHSLPVDDPLPLLLADARACERTLRDQTWLRVVDVGRALALRRYGAGGGLVLDVVDDFCGWNTGRYRLETDAAGQASVARDDGAEPALSLSVAALGAAYLGGTRFRALEAAGRVHEHLPGAIEVADALFAVARAPYCTTHF